MINKMLLCISTFLYKIYMFSSFKCASLYKNEGQEGIVSFKFYCKKVTRKFRPKIRHACDNEWKLFSCKAQYTWCDCGVDGTFFFIMSRYGIY